MQLWGLRSLNSVEWVMRKGRRETLEQELVNVFPQGNLNSAPQAFQLPGSGPPNIIQDNNFYLKLTDYIC